MALSSSRALSPEFKDALFRHITEQGFLIENALPLYGGRTNYVWHSGDMVIKLFAERTHNPLFTNDPKREISVLKELDGENIAPKFLGHGLFRGATWLVYHHIKGHTWTNDTSAVADLLGRLHARPRPPELPLGPNGSDQLEQMIQKLLALCPPCQETREIMIDAFALSPVPPLARPCLIHADPVSSNFVSGEEKLVLIDWQCPVLGDPTEDLATFLSPAMHQTYRDRVLSDSEIDHFLSTYPNPMFVERYLKLRPWYHRRMAAYCLWRGDQNAARLEISALNAISAQIG